LATPVAVVLKLVCLIFDEAASLTVEVLVGLVVPLAFGSDFDFFPTGAESSCTS